MLLGYAAEAGIEVKDTVRDGVIKARVEIQGGGIREQTLGNLLTALTTLAVAVKPVTVESLKASEHPEEARKLIRFYGWIAIGIGLIIVVFSLVTFVSSSMSEKIKADINLANSLASKLRVELGPSSVDITTATTNIANVPAQDLVWFGPGGIPAGLTDKDVISDLQQFAATMREINGYAWQLNHFVFNMVNAPHLGGTNRSVTLELTPGLEVRLNQELTQKVEAYQQVRHFGNNVQERVAVYYGALATCLLPVLYALLGTGAYLLRLYEDQIKNRTLTSGDRHIARFLIAGIGGLVVGLFNNVTQGVTISPFALAFLVGYAVDVFFAFLEGLLQLFKRGSVNPGAPGSGAKM